MNWRYIFTFSFFFCTQQKKKVETKARRGLPNLAQVLQNYPLLPIRGPSGPPRATRQVRQRARRVWPMLAQKCDPPKCSLLSQKQGGREEKQINQPTIPQWLCVLWCVLTTNPPRMKNIAIYQRMIMYQLKNLKLNQYNF